jgi:lipopolysaccharide biosynthesis glycosyltransferase
MAEQNGTIHIASAFDRHYITPFYVLLTSVFANNRKNSITIHSIATGVSKTEKEEIKNFVLKNNAEIFFYDIDEEYVRKNVVVPINNYFTIATYYRLFLPSLLPVDVKKLLYIDTDAIVLDDLKELYTTDIDGLPFGAVSDPYPVIRTDLGLYEEGKYFNAGVLLIDIENWKQQQVMEKAMRFIADHPEKIRFVDQDALNATQKDKWYRLDGKYNMTWLEVSLQVPKKELVKDKVIIHYTTAHKPWNSLGRNKLRYLYHQYLKMSPRSNERKYTDFNWDISLLMTFVKMRIKEFYFDAKLNKVLFIKSWHQPTDIY